MPSPAEDPGGTIHFVGIAGAGMRALAELFARRGIRVTGCDANPSTAADLARFGISIIPGHSPDHVEGVSELVVTSAMARDNAEIARARELGIRVTRRAEALGRAVSGGRLVAIAGTHGKTTTTVMSTSALTAAGLRPTGIVGGRVTAWESNLHYDSDDLFVVEADEYDRSFLALAPTVAVVTNMEADHLDIYRDLDDIRTTFSEFVSRAPFIVLCSDDDGARSLDLPNTAEVIRYGLHSPDARLRASAVRPEGDGTAFTVSYDAKPIGDLSLRVPGIHNVQNALASIGAGLALGTTLDAMRAGLESFGGVERRFERVGDVADVTIVDDYAHHPTEIAATLEAARSTFPGRRIVAAFQPHLYSRTRDFASEFGAVLCGADMVFLADIYPSREKPMPGITSDLVSSAMKSAGRPVAWQGPRAELAEALSETVRAGDVVITIGAGDITLTARELRERLQSRAT